MDWFKDRKGLEGLGILAGVIELGQRACFSTAHDSLYCDSLFSNCHSSFNEGEQ